MDQGLIPRRYAKALFEVGQQRGQNDRLYEMMLALSGAFEKESGLQQTMANPFVADADKEVLISAAVGAGGDNVPDTFIDFVKLLERKRRISIVRDIAIAYVDLFRKENHVFNVSVVSAAPLDQSVRDRMTSIIKAHLGDGVLESSFTVNPGLIGGFTIRVGNELLDASVATQLEQIRLSLVK